MTPATNQRFSDVAEPPFDSTSSAEKRIGTIVAGSYRLTRHIGSGGSSHVFQAEHVRLGKTFAVKLLRPELDPNRRTAQRFRREARAIARLKSEHIVTVIDCGELDDGTPYLVMELLEGEDLRSLLNRERSLPARRAVPLIIEACRGLSEVHAAGLVHRDLKPENLFITRRSTGEDWCKVLDFGVAKMEASLSTAQGAIVGTLRYMAPEQLAASSSVAATSDIYALGAILYECLSGEHAHPGDTAQEVMYSVMNRAAAAAPLHAAKVPTSLIDVVMGCLAKQQQARPSDAAELSASLSGQVAGAHGGPTFPTMSEDDTSARSVLPRAKRALSRSFARTAGLVALATTALLWWLRPNTVSHSESPPGAVTAYDRATEPGLASPPHDSAPFVAPAVTASQPIPRQEVAGIQSTPPDASAMPRRFPAPKPVRAPASAAPAASSSPPPRMQVGGFDPANPYAE